KEVRVRIEAGPRIAGVLPAVIRRGQGLTLHLSGANFEGSLNPVTLNFGDGITVDKIEAASADHIVVAVRAAQDAKVGARDIPVGTARKSAAMAVYEKIDYIRVLPEKSMARLGGVTAPKRLIQFEAHAFSNGADGSSGTADDIDLGVVRASWSLGESYTSYG